MLEKSKTCLVFVKNLPEALRLLYVLMYNRLINLYS